MSQCRSRSNMVSGGKSRYSEGHKLAVSMPLSQQYGFWLLIIISQIIFGKCLNAALAAIWFLASEVLTVQQFKERSQCRSRSNMVSGILVIVFITVKQEKSQCRSRSNMVSGVI